MACERKSVYLLYFLELAKKRKEKETHLTVTPFLSCTISGDLPSTAAGKTNKAMSTATRQAV